MGLRKALFMAGRIWFNARVLCCEQQPEMCRSLVAARARTTWAPLGDGPDQQGRWRTLRGNWADPDYPYRLVEGHEVVLVLFPHQPGPPENVRSWVCGMLHLFESARRSRVRALGFAYALEQSGLELRACQFLEEFLLTQNLPTFVNHQAPLGQGLLATVEAALA